MGNLAKTVLYEFSSTALTGSFQNWGSVLADAALKVQFINSSNVSCYITDGVSNWQVPASATATLDEFNNPTNHGHAKVHIPKGAQLQIKQKTGAGTGTNDIIGHIVMER